MHFTKPSMNLTLGQQVYLNMDLNINDANQQEINGYETIYKISHLIEEYSF